MVDVEERAETQTDGVRQPLAALVSAALLVAAMLVSAATPASASSDWDVITSPPAMAGATEIELSAAYPTEEMPAWGILCSGRHHEIKLGPNEDAVIRFAGSEPIRYPIWVVGGRNVRIVGLEMELETQPGCGVGELPNSGSSATNIHPRIPSAMAVRLENYGTSFVEGADIDLRGHEADCFVVRNPADLSNADARNQRHVVLQNTSCRGIEGLGQSAIGDGVHGDLLQNQGNDVISSLTLENVSVRTSMEGLVLHEWDGYSGARRLTIRRFDYAADDRYDDDDAYEQWGVAFAAWADEWELSQVHIQDPRGNDYGFVNDQRYGGFNHGVVRQHAGIHRHLPAGGSFAPTSMVGIGYVSPHDGITAGDSSGSHQGGEPTAATSNRVTRLYQAAFGRRPDSGGLTFWEAQMTAGMSLEEMAARFQDSTEWRDTFGVETDDPELIGSLYRNVLGRQPDAAGQAYWLQQLAAGDITDARLLIFFSESPENVARTGTG